MGSGDHLHTKRNDPFHDFTMSDDIDCVSSLSYIQTLHCHFSGTVDNICWLAPEVLAQDLSGYSEKSDVYSIGIAALELATGEAPFAGLPVTEVDTYCNL